MKPNKKYGFKKYISKSLPLPTTKNYNTVILTKKSIVYYISPNSNKVYGELDKVEEEKVYCYWQKYHDATKYVSWGWMDVDSVFIDDGVPIITLDWDESIGVKPQ
jgi:hypothetical protein